MNKINIKSRFAVGESIICSLQPCVAATVRWKKFSFKSGYPLPKKWRKIGGSWNKHASDAGNIFDILYRHRKADQTWLDNGHQLLTAAYPLTHVRKSFHRNRKSSASDNKNGSQYRVLPAPSYNESGKPEPILWDVPNKKAERLHTHCNNIRVLHRRALAIFSICTKSLIFSISTSSAVSHYQSARTRVIRASQILPL